MEASHNSLGSPRVSRKSLRQWHDFRRLCRARRTVSFAPGGCPRSRWEPASQRADRQALATGAHSSKDRHSQRHRHRHRNGARGRKRNLAQDQAAKEQVQKPQEARPERDIREEQHPGKVAGKEKRETR